LGIDWKLTVMIPVGVIAQGGATVPGSPTSFTASPTSNSVSLNWVAPGFDGGLPITNYTVYRGLSSIHTTASGSVTSFNDTGLANATSYSYRVSANNSIGSSISASVSTTTLATVPTAPQSFTATAASSNSINLSWAAPSSNGGAAITSYTISRNETPIHTTANGSTTSFSDTGLAPATGYSYRVRANNSVGAGPNTNPATSATTFAGVPSALTSYGSAQTANLSGNFYWDPPADNGSPILYYFLNYGTSPYYSTSYSVGGSWGDYELTVQAVNAVGVGPAVTWSLTLENYGPGYWD